MTLISGTSHLGVPSGSHDGDVSFFTSAPNSGRPNFKNTISLDQFIAEKRGHLTRHPYLCLSTKTSGARPLSYHRNGNAIPTDRSAKTVFERLFVEMNPQKIKEQRLKWQHERSVLDGVTSKLKAMSKKASLLDRQQLDQYLTSVRETELRLQRKEAWLDLPSPKASEPLPKETDDENDILAKSDVMLKLIHLALVSDNTRVISLGLHGTNTVPPIDGITVNYHGLSHHAQVPKRSLN